MNCSSSNAFLACGFLAITGCASQPIYVPLPTSHPASPWAWESPVPAQSGTLAIHKSDMVPPHPDWQIPGMRDNELHGHAAGSPTAMDKMGHGHMMMKNGHGEMGADHAPGMVKMEAPRHHVDYTPEGAVHPGGREPKEHEPERHLDHTEPRRHDTAPYQAAPVAPPMDHSAHDRHRMPQPKKQEREESSDAEQSAVHDHQAMDHSAHETPSDAAPEPSETSAEDNSRHAH